jgi:hypothetical protein
VTIGELFLPPLASPVQAPDHAAALRASICRCQRSRTNWGLCKVKVMPVVTLASAARSSHSSRPALQCQCRPAVARVGCPGAFAHAVGAHRCHPRGLESASAARRVQSWRPCRPAGTRRSELARREGQICRPPRARRHGGHPSALDRRSACVFDSRSSWLNYRATAAGMDFDEWTRGVVLACSDRFMGAS